MEMARCIRARSSRFGQPPAMRCGRTTLGRAELQVLAATANLADPSRLWHPVQTGLEAGANRVLQVPLAIVYERLSGLGQ
jgi:hypothetical protein